MPIRNVDYDVGDIVEIAGDVPSTRTFRIAARINRGDYDNVDCIELTPDSRHTNYYWSGITASTFKFYQKDNGVRKKTPRYSERDYAYARD